MRDLFYTAQLAISQRQQQVRALFVRQYSLMFRHQLTAEYFLLYRALFALQLVAGCPLASSQPSILRACTHSCRSARCRHCHHRAFHETRPSQIGFTGRLPYPLAAASPMVQLRAVAHHESRPEDGSIDRHVLSLSLVFGTSNVRFSPNGCTGFYRTYSLCMAALNTVNLSVGGFSDPHSALNVRVNIRYVEMMPQLIH